jgi:hypothetical protein
MRTSKGLICATLLLVALAGKPALAQKIHVLMFADTADKSIGSGVGVTVDKVRHTFASLVPRNRYTFTAIESHNIRFTAAMVYQAIRRLQVANDDTFVFIADMHGGHVGERHFLVMPDRSRVWSSTLRNRVNAKTCDLKLIITDSCNVSVRRQKSSAAKRLKEWDPNRNGMAPVMEELFIWHTGLLHMNSTWPGQYAFVDNNSGSWFLGELFDYCSGYPTARPNWWCMDRCMDRTMAERFQLAKSKNRLPYEARNQKTLHPVTWRLPKSTTRHGTRLGVTASDTGLRTGAKVLEVDANSPANGSLRIWNPDSQTNQSGSLQEGDILLSINGTRINDEDTFYELVKCSPKQMNFTFQRQSRSHRAEVVLLN